MARKWKREPSERSEAPPAKDRKVRRPFSWFWFLASLVWTLSVGVGIAVGWTFTSVSGLAERVRELEKLRPSLPSVVYDMNGRPVYEFAVQKRVPVERYEDIPPLLRSAIVAVEDDDFFRHPGINPLSMLRAVYYNLRAGRVVQGGSTITQQLAKMLFLTPERTLDRKLKEIFLALHIEKHFTKQEIFLHYYNNVYMGHGVYGFEAAARYYFGKPAAQLRPEEAALLAGLVSAPNRYSPYLNPQRAGLRRNYALRRLLEERVISRDVYERARQTPIRVIAHEERPQVAAYFLEEVRRFIEAKYGYDTLYTGGLRIYTTLDLTAQQLAEAALRDGLYELARRQPWSGPLRNVCEDACDPSDLASLNLPEWSRTLSVGDRLPALVVSVSPEGAVYRIGTFTGLWKPPDLADLRASNLLRKLRPGDVVMARIEGLDPEHRTLRARLENVPLVEGAIVVMDTVTGEVRAMVGGLDFQRSQFNRVTQARRQVGSAFKPIVWTAALEAGLSLSTIVEDAPFFYEDPITHVVWSPGNFDNRFMGWVTLRRALEFSRNTVSARLITRVGVERVLQVARRLGIESPLPPYPSIALGAVDLTPLELTAAYAAFANGGLRVRPYWIRRVEDRYGRPLEVHVPQTDDALSPEVAFVVTWALRGVVLRGTAAGLARNLPFEAAGKTGTTDEFTNAWFIGFTPSVVCGVWIGYDEPKRLGYNETGARAALPIWVRFMRAYMEGRPPETFQAPAGVVMLPVDYYTGLRASPECDGPVILEAFLPGTEPLEYCSPVKNQEVSHAEGTSVGF
jgi:penicillin-binding protein 1A